MSKKSKKKASEARKVQKRKRKAAAQAQYDAWRDQGQNKKSKRAQKHNQTAKTVRAHRHRVRTPARKVTLAKKDGTTFQLTEKQYRNTMSLRQYLRHMKRHPND
jgi:glutamate synthase domain-containing protein 2